MNGVSISPRVEYKFLSQDDDPVNGSNLCNRAFGSDATRRFKQFRSLFAVQDPILPIPTRKIAPNHKIDPLLLQMLFAFGNAWDPGPFIAGDEQDAGFKGKHPDKARVTFKKEGDGFLIDALCDDGFTLTFYFRNMPSPKKWISKNFSPTHARILFMFEQLQGKNFTCGLDNLYISAKFCRAALTLDQQIMTHGVCRTSNRGLPKCVLMQEKCNDIEKAAARGQVKAAVLKGDEHAKDMIAFSVYDTKPVHFISTASLSLKWIKKKKLVYDKVQNEIRDIEFLRTNIQNDYNNGMNDVDISDQLRKIYCFNRWLRNRKWWWAIFMWALGVILVNAYVAYVSANTLTWCKKKKDLLSHYEFRKAIALALIAPEEFYDRFEPEEESVASSHTSSSTTRQAGRPAKRRRVAITRSVSTKPVGACRVNDKTLHPVHGALKCRLNRSVPHLPDDNVLEQRNKSLRCALHRWNDWDSQIKRDVVICSTCKVSLCIWCFKKFHEEPDVSKLKHYLNSITS